MRTWFFIAALTGGLSVLLGAFAAHGLSSRIGPEAIGWFETGARYQMYHALAIGLAALLQRGLAPHDASARWAARACMAFLAGVLLFSGSLYLLALTGHRALGMITPLGGLAFLLGWGLLGLAAWKQR